MCHPPLAPVSAELLVSLIPVDKKVVHQAEGRVVLIVVGLLPWLHWHLMTAIDFRDPEFYVTILTKNLIATLQLCPSIDCGELVKGFFFCSLFPLLFCSSLLTPSP